MYICFYVYSKCSQSRCGVLATVSRQMTITVLFCPSGMYFGCFEALERYFKMYLCFLKTGQS